MKKYRKLWLRPGKTRLINKLYEIKNQRFYNYFIILQFFIVSKLNNKTDSIIKKMEENQKIVELKNLPGNDLV